MTAGASIGTDHPAAVSYRRTVDAFRAGDLDAVAATIDDGVIWHLPGTTCLAREIHGRDAVLAFLKEIMNRTSGTFVLNDISITGCDDHVLAVQRLGARVDGEERLFDATSVMRFTGGLQKERWLHISDQVAFDEFFGRF